MDLGERGEPGPEPPSPGITLLERAAQHHKKEVVKNVKQSPQCCVTAGAEKHCQNIRTTQLQQRTSSFEYEYASACQSLEIYFRSPPLLTFQGERKPLV